MADRLEEAHGIVTQEVFKKMETACGLKYVRNGLPYDRRARSLAPYPRVLYWDWMHILVASGGVFQYGINSFVINLTRTTGVTLQMLDEFTQQVRLNGGRIKLAKTFWQDRVVSPSKDETHPCMKAFASEMLTATQPLAIFARLVLTDKPALAKHVEWLLLADTIVQMLCLGDVICGHRMELQDIIVKHNNLFKELYPRCCKPKIHYFMHIVECMICVALSCFPGERNLRIPKSLPNCYKGFHVTLMRHTVHHFLNRLRFEPNVFKPVYISGKRSARTPAGEFRTKDIVCWSNYGALSVGSIQAFYQVCDAGGVEEYRVQVQSYRYISENKWCTYEDNRTEVLPLLKIWHAVCMKEEADVRIFLPPSPVFRIRCNKHDSLV